MCEFRYLFNDNNSGYLFYHCSTLNLLVFSKLISQPNKEKKKKTKRKINEFPAPITPSHNTIRFMAVTTQP